MDAVLKHWRRIAVTLLPLVFALLHAAGAVRIDVLQRLEDIIYDARLRATMPGTLDERIIIVDIDEASLAELGRWPWSRNKLAALTNELFDRQQIALLGFDVVFAEPDDSSGLKQLSRLSQNEFRDFAAFGEKLDALRGSLDYDVMFATALRGHPVVLGYYATSDREGRTSGTLPAPVMVQNALLGRAPVFTSFNGYGANIEPLARAAPVAGFFNTIAEVDGVVRTIPLIAEVNGEFHESLSLAMFRMLAGSPAVAAEFSRERYLSRNAHGLENILLSQGGRVHAIPVDRRGAILIPYRGPGGVKGGSFRYVSAADVLARRIPEGSLKGKTVLLGTTAPGLLDLRTTPVGQAYPGVEANANVLSGLLDNRVFVTPDYALGYEVAILMLAGLLLAVALPLVSAPRAVMLSVAVVLAVIALNFWLYGAHRLVLPLASALVMVVTAFALNMSYGYFVESRSKRELAHLFGTYVPPELVDEMVKDPDSYSMMARNKDMTVMFCDMRGFTKLSEHLEPTQLQELLNSVFSRLTQVIRANRGTIDKYMGDCVMAFWGAPVETSEHPYLAVKTAMEIAQSVRALNQEHLAKGLPEIGIGVGVNTGTMCVGDMGSDIRRAYTVIGDAVNLGSRLEGLSKVYAVDAVVSEATRMRVPQVAWAELDKVRVKGKDQAVSIYCPIALAHELSAEQAKEIKTWTSFLKAYRAQDWEQSDNLMLNLLRMNAKKYLYQLYSERVASMRLLPFDPKWDGATNFETK
ncbi:CHASE2 domain-containing protein [Rhodoferax sp.]|uniref:CHASE2 domain-containing protein n=1 Tax=Rhodoferax sp. TaxID=50421 RepID=UPI00276FA386|nr:adenylate/guanylate cyclase domain-containing protein [Rhodoferax sp.]